jgi:hypothetical protein
MSFFNFSPWHGERKEVEKIRSKEVKKIEGFDTPFANKFQ